MKSLLAIYATAVIVGVVTANFVNSTIDGLVVKNPTTEPESSLAVTLHPHGSSVVVPNLQGGSPNTVAALQDTERVYVVQPTDTNQQIQTQDGGNGSEDELQPALGYGALDWVLQ
jgi:hypothetical protein